MTGHRNLSAESSKDVEERIDSLIDSLITHGRPIRVISPLAAGADQLVAQAALRRGVVVESPLPLRLELYEKDFDDPTPLRELVERVASAGGEVAAIPYVDDLTDADVSEYGPARDRMYEAVGRRVVDLSDELLVVWDGVVNGKTGGVAETLRYALGLFRDPALKVHVINATRSS